MSKRFDKSTASKKSYFSKKIMRIFAMTMPTEQEIARACAALLVATDLEAITLREVRVALEAQFGPSPSASRDR